VPSRTSIEPAGGQVDLAGDVLRCDEDSFTANAFPSSPSISLLEDYLRNEKQEKEARVIARGVKKRRHLGMPSLG
jgi:hypothetical protein